MKCSGQCFKGWLRDNLLLLLTLVGVAVGFILVLSLQSLDLSDDAKMWIGLPGELFMRGLRCMIIPVLVASIMTATASIDPKSNGKMSAVALTYIFGTVFLGVVTGLVLSLTIKPGDTGADLGDSDYAPAYYETQDVIADLFRNLIPENIVQACLETIFTEYTFEERNVTGTNMTEEVPVSKTTAYTSSTNILGLLVFSAAIGISMSRQREETRTMFDFMWALRITSLKVLSVFLWLLPLGTACLIFSALIDVSDLGAVWTSLGLFIGVVIAGLAIHFFITLPLIFFLSTRKNPYAYWLRCARPAILATVTKTNLAILPELLHACEVKCRVRATIVNYVVPLNTGIKADGSAVFIISGALWLAQTSNTPLNAGQVITAGVVAWVMGNSLPSVPSASLVAMVTVCSAAGIPSENIGLLLSVEWLLDGLRTSVNCMSHCASAGVVDGIMGKEIEAQELERKLEAEQAEAIQAKENAIAHKTESEIENGNVVEANSVANLVESDSKL
ncbi:excitatory amino acid transporter-like [Ptychodera flava]|uniref:excitatory amino acid transporter-like n=1 Tax=Ptychodera flava TaxID=63121 RepID=UPI003969F81E